MLKVVFTSFFFYYNSRTRTGYNFAPSSTRLMLYLKPYKFPTIMVEWLSRWTSDQTAVGSTPITDDIFLITIFMIFLPS